MAEGPLGDLVRRADGARAVILVEGVSDQEALDALATRRGRDLSDERVVVASIGGSKNIGRAVAALGSDRRLAGLCDAGEERDYRRGLARAGYGAVATREDLEQLGFFVCEPDLEGELIRSLGAQSVERVLADRGELASFRTFQRQPAWRGRDPAQQLRRFLGVHSGR